VIAQLASRELPAPVRGELDHGAQFIPALGEAHLAHHMEAPHGNATAEFNDHPAIVVPALLLGHGLPLEVMGGVERREVLEQRGALLGGEVLPTTNKQRLVPRAGERNIQPVGAVEEPHPIRPRE
jgi:hypothetical protein